jgi:pimeloyl-ACP methyl ester carboxylesterase
MSILEYLFACFEDLVDKSSKTSRMNAGLVEYVERTVRSERSRAPDRPVYIVGDSVGACIALAVAARNQDIDLVLILVNPGLDSVVHGFCIYCSALSLDSRFSLTSLHSLWYLQGHLSTTHSCRLSQHSWIWSLIPSISALHSS